jgi:hypothetical protein
MSMNRRHFLATAGSSVAILSFGRDAHALSDYSRGLDGLLKRYVIIGADGVNRVNYGAWARNRGDRALLDQAVADLVKQRPTAMSDHAGIAFWANLYNAITVRVILDRYPVKSIREIKSEGLFDPKAYTGPWRTKRVTVEGKSYSLDDIEHETMRPLYKDPRIHYALNCASIGCPNLVPTAWCESSLGADLDAAARAFINHPRGVKIEAGNQLRVSSIFEWFKVDFGGNDQGVLQHFRKYADAPLARAIDGGARIVGHDYDWTLNDTQATS